MFFVYGIKSQITGRVYIGQTSDIAKRLQSHNKGKVPSTREDAPWNLIAYEVFEARNVARWQEFQIKKSRGRRLKWLKTHSTGLRAGGAKTTLYCSLCK